ncbi:MAG: TlyA family RNA methyltransferase [Burkholderiaceae bacterium]
MAVRIDQRLVELGLAESRAKAQAMIELGLVTLQRPNTEPGTATKASLRIGPEVALVVDRKAHDQPVSRAAFKFDALIEAAGLDMTDSLCIDAGQSTGGFTERLIDQGVRYVLGVEVGHGQLASKLRSHDRVGCLEQTNIKSCTRELLAHFLMLESQSALSERLLNNGADIVSADLSFISLRKVMPTLAALLADSGHLLALVKPQFELGPGAVNRRGIISDKKQLGALRHEFEHALALSGLQMIHWLSSPITGSDGNTEFLMHAHRRSAPSLRQ